MTLVTNYRVAAAALAFLASTLSPSTNAKDVTEQITISGLTPIAQTRVSRTVFEYTYKIDIANNGSPLAGAVASLTSSSPKIQVVDATVNLGDLPGYAQGASKDTFSVRIDRSVAFDPSALHWQVNGEEARDVCNSIPAITLKTPTIQQTLPSSGSTGSIISLLGSGFNTCSRVFLGAKEISNIEVISDRKLHITVPFDIDSQSQLIPLAAGNYPIKVDTSSVYSFSVTDLPENPYPPGQVLGDRISSIFQRLTILLPQFQRNLPQLMEETKSEPNSQPFIQKLAGLANSIGSHGESTATQLMHQIDPISLNTLERAILLGQAVPTSDQPSTVAAKSTASLANSTSLQNTTSSPQAAGDQWLRDRQAFAKDAQLLSTVTGVSGKCAAAGAIGLANPYLVGTCLILGTASSLIQIIGEIEVTENWRYGIVKRMDLHISSFGAPDTVKRKGLLQEREFINLNINNADNNETKPTAQAKNILGATLYISHRPDWFQIANTVYSMAGEFVSLKITGNDWVNTTINELAGLLAIKLDKVLSQPTETREISTESISGSLADFLGLPTLTSDNCDIAADVSHFYVKTKPHNIFVVPDVSPGVDVKNVGSCDFQIIDDYRMPSEDSVYSEITFSVKKYPKINLKVEGNGSVTYGFKTFSGDTACESIQTLCTEYFDPGRDSSVFLFSNSPNGSSVDWNKDGVAICQKQLQCQVPLGTGLLNDPPLNVVASFTTDGLYGVRLRAGKSKVGSKMLECSRSPADIIGECPSPLPSYEEEYDGNGKEINVLWPGCRGGVLWDGTICRINGQFKAVSLTDEANNSFSNELVTSTFKCSSSMTFDGKTLTQTTIDIQNHNYHDYWGTGPSVSKGTSQAVYNLPTLTFSVTNEFLTDVTYARYEGWTESVHELSKNYSLGALYSAELVYLGPADSESCP